MTISELMEWLVDHYDVNDIVEMLKISPEELVEAFDFKVEENYDVLVREAQNDE